MSDTITCPDCGFQNPAGSVSCWHCNYPLVAEAPAQKGDAAGAPVADEGPAITRQSVRPARPRRPRAVQPVQTQLWLVFGAIAALIVIGVGVRGFRQNNAANLQQPVAGAKVDQQKVAEEMRARVARDSSDVEAHVTLADVLYDTANWTEAAQHYTIAARLDPKRAATVVDLGVCYFNMGDTSRADSLFRAALMIDPNLPQALFNLGIIAEHRESWNEALDFYHRAMQSGPPEPMQKPLVDAMQRVMAKTGSKAPPLPEAGGK